MSSRLRTVAHGLLWFAAVNFAALLVVAVALTLLGAVEPGRWSGALQVLRGAAESVPIEKLDGLRAIERECEERRTVPEENLLLESWRKLREERGALSGRAAEQWARLMVLAGFVEDERNTLDRSRAEWRAEMRRRDEERLRRQQELERVASEKLQRLYRYMSAGSIAADLEGRLEAGRPEEVARIVQAMPERSAAEVLEAFGDPAKRNQIYDLMAGRMGVVGKEPARAVP